MDQTSDTLSPLVIPYMAWRGRLSFQCGTLQKAKNDCKCNPWSRQKLSPQYTKLVVFYHHWSSLIWHEEEGFPSNVELSKKPKMIASATLGLGKNCPHIKRILLLWTKLVVLYHHWSSLIRYEEEGFPSNVGLSKKPKMTTSATLGLDKNCPHNKLN